MNEETLAAVGLLTDTNLRMLRSSLRSVLPIPRDDRFDELLAALDKTGGEMRAPS